jgi:ABC-2 type transport system permease protein
VLLAKAAVSVMATIVAMLVVEVVSFLIGALILDGRGVDVKLRHQDVAALVGEIALAVMLTLLGYGLGLLIRNSPATISILILWPLLLESLVRVVLNAAGVHNQTPWLPYQSAILLGNPDPDPGDPGRLHNVLYLGTIVVVCVIFGLFLNERRDA